MMNSLRLLGRQSPGTLRILREPADDLPADARRGLWGRPRMLPSKYLYDRTGSALFERICDLPEYYPTRTEEALLQRVAPEVADTVRTGHVLELGSGTARKTGALLRALRDSRRAVRYVPVDISPAALDSAARMVLDCGVEVDALVGDYTRDLHACAMPPGSLALFLGSTIGNLGGEAALRLLRDVGGCVGPGGWVLIGVDLVKPIEILEAAYDDAQGVTAAFNRNVLSMLNRELDADFDPGAFEHRAPYVPAKARIEMHLVARRDLAVQVRGLQATLTLRQGESVRTEISRKFTRRRTESLLSRSGFAPHAWFPSPDGWFALALARFKPGPRPAATR